MPPSRRPRAGAADEPVELSRYASITDASSSRRPSSVVSAASSGPWWIFLRMRAASLVVSLSPRKLELVTRWHGARVPEGEEVGSGSSDN